MLSIEEANNESQSIPLSLESVPSHDDQDNNIERQAKASIIAHLPDCANGPIRTT